MQQSILRFSLCLAAGFLVGAEGQCPWFASAPGTCTTDADCDDDEECTEGKCESPDSDDDDEDSPIDGLISDLCDKAEEAGCLDDSTMTNAAECRAFMGHYLDKMDDSGAACAAAYEAYQDVLTCYTETEPFTCSSTPAAECEDEDQAYQDAFDNACSLAMAACDSDADCFADGICVDGMCVPPNAEGEGEGDGEDSCLQFLNTDDGCDCGCFGQHDSDCDEVGGGCDEAGCTDGEGCAYCYDVDGNGVGCDGG